MGHLFSWYLHQTMDKMSSLHYRSIFRVAIYGIPVDQKEKIGCLTRIKNKINEQNIFERRLYLTWKKEITSRSLFDDFAIENEKEQIHRSFVPDCRHRNHVIYCSNTKNPTSRKPLASICAFIVSVNWKGIFRFRIIRDDSPIIAWHS